MGGLTIADRPDVIVGCEVTGCFPNDGVRVNRTLLFDLVKRPATRLPEAAA